MPVSFTDNPPDYQSQRKFFRTVTPFTQLLIEWSKHASRDAPSEPWEAYMWEIDYWELAADLAVALLIAIMIWNIDRFWNGVGRLFGRH
jgi:hypothetical protein